MAEAKALCQHSTSGLLDPQVLTLHVVFLGWASLHCALMQVGHCASVTVNLVSLAENSKVKKRSSFLLSDSLE